MSALRTLRVLPTATIVFARPKPPVDARRQCGRRHERQRRAFDGAAERAEHRPVVDGLRRRDRRVRVAHRRRGDHAALDDQRRLDAEERRPPQHEIRELADLDRADVLRDAVRDAPG